MKEWEMTPEQADLALKAIDLNEKYTLITVAKLLHTNPTQLSALMLNYRLRKNRVIKEIAKSEQRFYEPQRASFSEIVQSFKRNNTVVFPIINSVNPESFVKAEDRFPFLKAGLPSKF